jgi:2-polyprenyl-6-methoxyphenol hydroxylase-like FAD-dependent oxidoreductase
MNKLPVLIIGAGPTGLTLACELARRNIACRIVERSAEYPRGSRAKGVQPRSLEVFNDLGIVEKVLVFGNTDLPFRRLKGNVVLGDVPRPNFPRPDTQFTRGVIIPQWKIEELLREKLAEFGVVPELGVELVGFKELEAGVDGDVAVGAGVEVRLQGLGGTEVVACDYMIGCDGGKSFIRKALEINFAGETHEDERLLVGDVEIDGLVPDAWYTWPHPVYGFGVALCPFAHTKTWQLQAIALPDERGHLPEPTLETFNRVFQEFAQMPGVVLKNSTWQSLYRVNVRMAEGYRVGRVFIAGDAAHAHSIAGGLGMNTGIQDAYNLGWKLAAVLQGDATAGLLDTYEEERLPIAAWTLNISSARQKEVMDAAGGGGMAGTATKDTTQLNLNYRYSSLSVELADGSGSLRAGDRAPDARLSDGSWLFDLYRGTAFVVLGIGEAAAVLDSVKSQFGGKVKTELLTDVAAIAAFGRQGVFVVRPDGYIGLVAAADQVLAVTDWLSRFIKA